MRVRGWLVLCEGRGRCRRPANLTGERAPTDRPFPVPLSPNGGAPPTLGRGRPTPAHRGGSAGVRLHRGGSAAGPGPPPSGGKGGEIHALSRPEAAGGCRVRGRDSPYGGRLAPRSLALCRCGSRLARGEMHFPLRGLFFFFLFPLFLFPEGRSQRAFLQSCRGALGLAPGAAGSADLLPGWELAG